MNSTVDGVRDFVVDFKDDPLGAILAVVLLVLAADDGEGVHDVGDSVARRVEAEPKVRELFAGFVAGTTVRTARRAPASVLFGQQIQMEEGGVQLTAEQEAAVVVPGKRWIIAATIGCEGLKFPCGVDQLENALEQPFLNRLPSTPRHGSTEHLRRQNRNLLRDEEIEVGAAHLESGGEVADETRQKGWQ